MAKVNKTAAVVGAVVGLGLAEFTRRQSRQSQQSASVGGVPVHAALTRNRAPAPIEPARTPRARRAIAAPALTPERVAMMVRNWGMTPDRFHGRARKWAEAAFAEAFETPVRALPPAPELLDTTEATEATATTEASQLEPRHEDAQDAQDAWIDLLERFFALEPTPGHFYTVRPRDTPETIARDALRTVTSRPTRHMVNEYIWCFSAAEFNLERYGSRSTSKSFTSRWLVPGLGLGLRAAFLPRNADAFELMVEGWNVPRTVDDQGNRVDDDAGSMGTIWLPAVDGDAAKQGRVRCDLSHYDAETPIEPPRDIVSRLQEAA